MHLLMANVLGDAGWAATASQRTAYKTPCYSWFRWELACSCSCLDVTKKDPMAANTLLNQLCLLTCSWRTAEMIGAVVFHSPFL